jgi:uncharacterized 2Fe-2S/4Fe-4S cluster protein (DUF4445 family)
MPKITFLPDGISLDVHAGTTLLDAAGKARVAVRTRCGGQASCLMCKVHVKPDQPAALQQPTAREQRKLGLLPSEGIRLACQARIVADVTVHVPEDPLKAAIRKKLEDQNRERDQLW